MSVNHDQAQDTGGSLCSAENSGSPSALPPSEMTRWFPSSSPLDGSQHIILGEGASIEAGARSHSFVICGRLDSVSWIATSDSTLAEQSPSKEWNRNIDVLLTLCTPGHRECTENAYVLAAESFGRILSNDLRQSPTHPSYRTSLMFLGSYVAWLACGLLAAQSVWSGQLLHTEASF